MSRDSLAFENYANGYPDSVVDAAAMQRMFGDDVCIDKKATPCTLTAKAKAWLKQANSAMSGGRCEGFAVLSTLFSERSVETSDFGAADARSLTLADNTGLQRELAYWFATQLVPVVGEKTVSFKAKDVMPFLAQALAPNAKERYRLGIVKKVGQKITGGHALTPFAYYADAHTSGVYWLRVYDNNNPDTERLLKIDTKANRWEYEAGRNPKEKPSHYVGDDANGNLLYFSPVNVRKGTLPCAFCGTGSATTVTTGGGVEAIVKSGARAVGLKNGVFSASGGSALPSFSSDLDTEEASTVLQLDSTEPTISFELRAAAANEGDEPPKTTQSLEAVGANYSMALSGLSLSTSATDTVALFNSGAQVRYTNASHTPLTMSSQVDLANGKSLDVTVLAGWSDVIDTRIDPQTGALTVEATGTTGAQISVAVTQTNQDGTTQQGQFTFEGSDAGTLEVITKDWAPDGGLLVGTVDTGHGPVVLSDSCNDGKRSGMESDRDCGRICETRCGLEQGCSMGEDCASGVCGLSGVCVTDTCVDGRMNGNETDVDCGGSTCQACSTGRLCAVDGDCGAGACSSGKCVATFAIGFSVAGLPAGDSVEITNNGVSMTVNADASYLFSNRVTGSYNVVIATQPVRAYCNVDHGSGTATQDVGDVTVTCQPRYVVAGSVTGLSPSTFVVLQNNGGDDLTLSGDGSFTFATLVSGTYDVTVLTQPVGQRCTVSLGSGPAVADVSNVAVACARLSGLDTTFNGTGYFTSSFSPTVDFFTNLTLNLDGSLMLIGQTEVTPGVDNDWVIGKLLPNGTPDTTFGTGGFTTVSAGVGYENPRGVFADGDGYLVIGTLFGSNPDLAVVRLNANGSLDTTFGTNGVALYDHGRWEYFEKVARDFTGRFVVVGRASNTGAGPHDVVVARINPTGTLDTTFGTGGWFDFDDGGDEAGGAIAVEAVSADLVVAAVSGTDTVLLRLDASGALVPTFGAGGVATLDLTGTGGGELVYDLAWSNGDIVLAGRADGVTSDLVIASVGATGALNSSFGTSGRLLIDRGGNEVAYSLTPGPGGWYLGGNADDKLIVTRVTNAGAVDATFASSGFYENVVVNSSIAYQLVVDASGRLVIAGTIRASGNADLGAVRIQP